MQDRFDIVRAPLFLGWHQNARVGVSGRRAGQEFPQPKAVELSDRKQCYNDNSVMPLRGVNDNSSEGQSV